MQNFLLLLFSIFLVSCAPQPTYTWQDTRESPRKDASFDLEECKSYAVKQYKPGIPAGEPYLRDDPALSNETAESTSGEWRPDRNPTETTNINSLPVHDIPTEFTGYPGALDYYPEYLDDILEKCMSDRGWEYRAVVEGNND